MESLEILCSIANELAANIQKISDRVKTLNDEGHDASVTINELNKTCNELGKINGEIKRILN